MVTSAIVKMYCLAIIVLHGQDRGITSSSLLARDDMELIASNQLATGPLFPFNGRRRFTANVITDPIDSLDFIDDPR